MPRKHKTARQCQHYSHDLKKRIIYQSHILSKNSTGITISLDMPIHVVQRVLKLYRDTSGIIKQRMQDGRPPLMSESASEFMLALLEHSPDLYLDEIQEQLNSLHSLDVLIATIWRTLRRLGLTNKQLSRTAAERNEDLRLDFTMAIGDEPPNRVVEL
ncbi:hypothetical protein PAXINDRAFT_157674 [Paxillus involutus ATCC 200175]|uniref:Uncharacterized protein n=1 Tax=Paxillus involutus ATCC 200175 TaxID=664439 RepID=A0A0C9T3Q7_PAXIN|nr:hypothetical protein PAXINDRAFT_157674 [Paxillus involutus ATCC 200175]